MYKVCLLKSTYSVLGDIVSSMSKLEMRSTWYNSHRQKWFGASGRYIITVMCPLQMGRHFEKLHWVFHLSICLLYQVECVLSKWKSILRNSCGCFTFQNALPHFSFSSFLWYLAGVKRQNDKKKLVVFYTRTKWGARHLQNKHPLTLGPSDLGRCLFWKSSHITLYITSSEFTYQGVYPNTYSLKPYHMPNQHCYLFIWHY
jgi:hypothetical protein